MEDRRRRASKRRSTEDEEELNGSSKKSNKSPSGTNSPVASPDPPAVFDYPASLPSLPAVTPEVKKLSKTEVEELEKVLEFRSTDDPDCWKDDWCGNLALCEKDILNPSMKATGKKSFRQTLILWAVNSLSNARLLRNLLRFVCTTDNVPEAAVKVLGGVNESMPVADVIQRIRRAHYDPQVLVEDGWTTEKVPEPQGATGGAHLIGNSIRTDGSDATIIAYVHDDDIGDLWKGLWLDDLVSFDMEAEEMLDARKKWERRHNAVAESRKPRKSKRFSENADFTVKGVEHGVVLSASYAKGARPGVYWPARVMHASEAESGGQRRSSTAKKLDLVFLAPYWRAEDIAKRKTTDSMSDNNSSMFGPLLQLETVEASDDMIKAYPESATKDFIDVDQLQMSFRFTGLPKTALGRYLDAHRLAMALRHYARRHIKAEFTATDKASAGLFETHPMSVQAPKFPSVILHLPFVYILSQLKESDETKIDDAGKKEPILQLNKMVRAMKPPQCWGTGETVAMPATPASVQHEVASPGSWLQGMTSENSEEDHTLAIEGFVLDYPLLNDSFNKHCSTPPLVGVLGSITRLLAQLAEEQDVVEGMTLFQRRFKLQSLVTSWAIVKRLGEESLASLLHSNKIAVLVEWRRAMERIYKYTVAMFSDGKSFGNGISMVITDPRCNEHRTSGGCFERNVRLPAALKGARLAGAGKIETTKLVTEVPEHFVDLVKETFLPKTHDGEYLRRMKTRCEAAPSEADNLILTDDSDGDGGGDTVGSKGTWMAAVTGVAAAVAGANMIVSGECVNAFCVTRPPGHHAGRSLHPMKAVSNGFCILNAVACAAIYATSPVSEGGLGLSRVCVIDFDVHHGNGTQDILCSTYDPRYLYVSLHAGGAEINGLPMIDDPNHELHDLGSNPKMSGIYPGRCGDTSPHAGVLNIPLGAKVNSHDVGTALLSQVAPKVERFSPDLIILSAGFDAHKSDPMGLGGLRAEDFAHVTGVACQMAFKSCSGRVLSVLEGGYGVPCCRPQKDLFLPDSLVDSDIQNAGKTGATVPPIGKEKEGHDAKMNSNSDVPLKKRPQPSKLIDLGDDLPDAMDDQVPYALQVRLEKCHAEGFIECVEEHVKSLVQCSKLPN